MSPVVFILLQIGFYSHIILFSWASAVLQDGVEKGVLQAENDVSINKYRGDEG